MMLSDVLRVLSIRLSAVNVLTISDSLGFMVL